MVYVAERLKVASIEEESPASPMGHNMIDDRGLGQSTCTPAHPAVGFMSKVLGAQLPPFVRMIPLVIDRSFGAALGYPLRLAMKGSHGE
jgi:hypothetical protein